MFKVTSPAKIAALAVCSLACCTPLAAGQRPLSGSEWYRAEKCAGDYVCDEDNTGAAVAWLQVCVDVYQESSEALPRKTTGGSEPGDPLASRPSPMARHC